MRRKIGLFLACGLLLPLVVTASASGQGAMLRIDDQTPAPGQQVTITGSGFSSGAGITPISIRFDSRSAPERASGTANSQGFITPAITMNIPQSLSPGWHLIFGTQTVEANGRAAPFTPGRVRINVGASGSSGASAGPAGGGGGLPGSPLAVLALGSALLVATGAALTARRLRAPNRPQLGSQPVR